MATTAGKGSSWWLLVGLVAGACVVATTETTPEIEGAERALLNNVGPGIIETAIAAFQDEADALVEATAAWSETRQSNATGTNEKQVAQAAYIEAMRAWQRMEPMQFGPAGPALTTSGGLDLRDAIYSWPTVHPCRVDQEVAAGLVASPDDFDSRLVNVYGLDALEYLLFDADTDNACPPQTPPNAGGAWDELGPDAVESARARYSAVVALRLAEDAARLAAAWSAQNSGFSNALRNSGAEGALFATPTDAVNEAFAALFYLEKSTKDAKLGKPLGLVDCEADRCPDAIELPHSGDGIAAICSNLDGFRAMFTGGEGAGFDDLLRAHAQPELADEMIEAVDAALETCANTPGPLSETLTTNAAALESLYAALRVVTDLLKIEVAPALFLSIPDEAAGDND